MTRPNDHDALARRRDAGTLTWRGPALMLFARSAWAVVAQGLVAAIFALRSSLAPWHDAEPWLPVYGTLIDAGCLALLWRLARREGIGLFDLVGLDRARLFSWSFQHVVMPLTFDTKYMVFRLLSPVPFSVFQTLFYLRLRRLLPFAIAHAIMDGASVLIGVLLPLLRA